MFTVCAGCTATDVLQAGFLLEGLGGAPRVTLDGQTHGNVHLLQVAVVQVSTRYTDDILSPCRLSGPGTQSAGGYVPIFFCE